MTKSAKIFIRRGKAKIRRQILDSVKKAEAIAALYKKVKGDNN